MCDVSPKVFWIPPINWYGQEMFKNMEIVCSDQSVCVFVFDRKKEDWEQLQSGKRTRSNQQNANDMAVA